MFKVEGLRNECFATLLSKIDTDPIIKNSVICFVGDHIIFDTNMRDIFGKYCRERTECYLESPCYPFDDDLVDLY